MPKAFAFLLTFTLILVACAIPTKLPSISNDMGWTWHSSIRFSGDKDFTPEERSAIGQACLDWVSFTNGGIFCSVTFDRDFEANPYKGDPDDYVIIKTSSLGIWSATGGRIDPERILGLTSKGWNLLTGERRAAIMLATDNIGDEWANQRQVTKHEIGHVLGFEHIDEHHYRPNVMHAHYEPEADLNTVRPGNFGDDDLAQCQRLGLCRQ